MDAQLKAHLEGMEARLIAHTGLEFEGVEARLIAQTEKLEARLIAHTRLEFEGVEARLIAHTEELEARLIAQTEELEARLKAHTSLECEKIETKLLREFWKWGSTSDIRTRQSMENANALNERMLNAEDRISALERSRLPPRADAA